MPCILHHDVFSWKLKVSRMRIVVGYGSSILHSFSIRSPINSDTFGKPISLEISPASLNIISMSQIRQVYCSCFTTTFTFLLELLVDVLFTGIYWAFCTWQVYLINYLDNNYKFIWIIRLINFIKRIIQRISKRKRNLSERIWEISRVKLYESGKFNGICFTRVYLMYTRKTIYSDFNDIRRIANICSYIVPKILAICSCSIVDWWFNTFACRERIVDRGL